MELETIFPLSEGLVLKKLLLSAVIVAGAFAHSFSAIDININSGNPAVPFPRFLSHYPAGGQQNLYTVADYLRMPDGISHAELDQWMRDAWKIYTNRWSYSGNINYQNAAGGNVTVRMIHPIGTSGDDMDVSENWGYALLAAALMADKDAFDGMWMHMNENCWFNLVPRYSNANVCCPTYVYGYHSVKWDTGACSNSATDGDVDVAMAALIAWRQWGDTSGYYAQGGTGATNTNGLRAIEYRQMALDMMRFLVEKFDGPMGGADDSRVTSAVGFDGYHKSGDSWGEITNWANCPGPSPYCPQRPFGGPTSVFYDYTGPSYFRGFICGFQFGGEARDLTNDGGWNINQMRRAAASDFWLQGQLNPAVFPVAGRYAVSGTTATFQNDGTYAEDLRAPWRHFLDYVLYGNPPANSTWNPTTHQPDGSTPNNYEYQGAMKVANFINNNVPCADWGSYDLTFNKAAGMPSLFYMNGAVWNPEWHIVTPFGALSPAVIIGQNQEMMGDWLRQLLTLWDAAVIGDGYLTSIPRYFHGFFRVLGLLIMTGNYTDPCSLTAGADMKIYKAVNKTYAFTGDLLTYHLNYRNYGSVNATGVYVRDTLPSALSFVSSVPAAAHLGGGVYEWGPYTVNGLQNQNYNATMGGITLVVRVRDDAAQGRYCNTADIRAANGTGWTTSDQPNEITKIMKRNCVDIVAAALTLTKTANVIAANPGNTITYTLRYCNSSEAGWINGGRFGVTFSIGQHPMSVAGNMRLTIRGMHQAAEPWIDWSNYRVSYFVNSDLHGTYPADPNGWAIEQFLVEGTTGIDVTTEDLVPGCSGPSCWNQRVIMRFQPSISLPSHMLMKFFNNMPNMHYPDGLGAGTHTQNPLVAIVGLRGNGEPAQNWNDDWSKLPTTAPYSTIAYGDDQFPFPISPDWTAGDGTSVPVTTINKDSCNGTRPPITNVLIEEWDGYTWRRTQGNGPQPGRQVSNVVLTDSLPTQVTWGGFISSTPAGSRSGRDLIWNIGDLLVDECGEVSYWVTANGTCPMSPVNAPNTAFIEGTNESPVDSEWNVEITCEYVPPPPPPPSSVTKTASAATVNSGSNITYTIAYTNLNGTSVNSATDSTVLGSAANWTRELGTADWTFNGTARPPSAQSVMVHNYSRGANGIIYVSANLTDSGDFSVKFRNNCYVRLNSTWAAYASIVDNGVIRAEYNPGSGGGIPLNVDLRIELNGAQVNVFMKDQSSPSFPPAPFLTTSAMTTTTAGFAGLAQGYPAGANTWGGHTVTHWRTELDTAFDILVRDPLPNGMGFVSASNSGSLYAPPDPDEVRWPLIPQLNHGQGFTYTWIAQASGSVCGPVVNVAYVEPRGVTYTVGAQVSVDVDCTGSTPTFTRTRTPTPTFTRTASPSPSRTATPSFTHTPSPSATSTFTYTPSLTRTSTPTFTRTVSPTFTRT
ncbi:MAG TPA: DUF11 domain-containing protein, partial [bacterium]|nr:DUF11 domain-containing protein [bacterium]